MASTTTIIITRPNTNELFFYDCQFFIDNEPEYLPYYFQAVTNSEILSFTRKISPDNLVHTSVITYPTAAEKDKFCSIFYGAYPDYLAVRKTYCESVGHTIEVIEA